MDAQYKDFGFQLPQISHGHGDNLQILADPYLLTLLAKSGQKETQQPLLNSIFKTLYRGLFQYMVSSQFPQKVCSIETRMKESNEKGEYNGPSIDPNTEVVTVALARAGLIPSQVCFDLLHQFLPAENIRQDHFTLNRRTNELGEVVGVDMGASKIGGPIDKKILVIADPMGATGGTLVQTLSHYRECFGKWDKVIALHLIVTPEYVKNVHNHFPDVKIMAIRYDRGLSSKEVLEKSPGTVSGEIGLNEIQYIVPGAGGIGELMNNAFV